MAEGGNQHTRKVNTDNIHLSACRLLECPICLEQMQKPKSLPCLHSFCEECLSSFIIRDMSGDMAAVTSFPCPVCRKITSPTNHSERKETWAQQFPTNNLVQYLISCKGSAETPLYCGPCKKTKNMETPAISYCKSSEMLFCDFCKMNVHDVFHDVCDIVTFKETKPDLTWNQPSTVTCPTHNEKMDYYCESHKFIGCCECIIAGHRRCYRVMSVKEYCKRQKGRSKHDGMGKSLGEVDKCLELMLNTFDHQFEQLQQCQDVCLKSVADVREKINTFLDKKQAGIIDELNLVYKAEKEKVDVFKQKCIRLKAAVQNTKELSRSSGWEEDDIGTLQLFHRGQTEIVACNNLIDEVARSSKSVSIKHDIGPKLSTIDESSTLTFGGICVKEQPCMLPDGVECVPNVGLLSECRVRRTRTFNIGLPSDTTNCSAYGVVLMPNDNIIVSDYSNKKLKLFSPKDVCLNQLKIGNHVRDMCISGKETVAVVFSAGENCSGILTAKVQSTEISLIKKINLSGSSLCYGITVCDEGFAVSTSKHIQTLTVEGKTHVSYSSGTECHYLTYCPNQEQVLASLNTSTSGKVALTVISPWKQPDVLKVGVVTNAMGVDVDYDGNIYVCGQSSNNVVQISADGTKVRELLTSKDGITQPRAISVRGDKFVVTNISSTHRNHVDVYQLY
ncbi:uncharacterized protein LOC132546085 [Ylistrum balloti]|uniref:uncharacterized protein LOC132546085 n=1 Tax=Ylistrum balloti TaxID=509963 RepID=UPI002905D008|nr:uncharacterized protein LOC132546085 [Ylistrum balloti]